MSIVVDDDGSGIDPVYREDVFRPFYRLDEARNQDEGGAGLGLAICKELVAAQGGKIWIDDSVGAGASVCFTLPVAPTNA